MAETARRLRCAIYTRKSTEEGLEQEFNTLQAQREAAEAYIRSQQLSGWVALPEAFADGGFSEPRWRGRRSTDCSRRLKAARSIAWWCTR